MANCLDGFRRVTVIGSDKDDLSRGSVIRSLDSLNSTFEYRVISYQLDTLVSRYIAKK